MNDGGKAFPQPSDIEGRGMSLRDYFAAKALPACYAQVCTHCEHQGWPEGWRQGVADDAYKMADAMLKAREPQGDADK